MAATPTSLIEAQMIADQERILQDIKKTSDILGNNKWRALVSEDDSSSKADTETELEEEGEQRPVVQKKTLALFWTHRHLGAPNDHGQTQKHITEVELLPRKFQSDAPVQGTVI